MLVRNLAVQEDYYCCLNNLLFTVYNLINVVFLLNHALWVSLLISIHQNNPDSNLVLAKRDQINPYSANCAWSLWEWGSTFLAIVTSSLTIVQLSQIINLLLYVNNCWVISNYYILLYIIIIHYYELNIITGE